MARKTYKAKSVRAQRKQYRREVRKLQDLGLYTGKPDFRKKPSRSALAAIRKYRSVLDRRATVVEASSLKAAKQYKGFLRRGRMIVVPRQKHERVSIDKKDTIKTTRRVAGRKVEKRILTSGKIGKIEIAPGKRGYWVMPIRQGRELTYQRFERYEDLREFMLSSNSGKPGERFEDWEEYVELEEVEE